MSKLLFDVSQPEDAPKKKRGKRRAATVAHDDPVFSTPTPAPAAADAYLGRLDGVFSCADESCWSMCQDITDSGIADVGDGGRQPAWRVECFVCGTGQWVPRVEADVESQNARKSHEVQPAEEFTFDEGPFAGMTPKDVFDRYGRDTLVLLANDRRHPSWRDACRNHLDTLQSAP